GGACVHDVDELLPGNDLLAGADLVGGIAQAYEGVPARVHPRAQRDLAKDQVSVALGSSVDERERPEPPQKTLLRVERVAGLAVRLSIPDLGHEAVVGGEVVAHVLID